MVAWDFYLYRSTLSKHHLAFSRRHLTDYQQIIWLLLSDDGYFTSSKMYHTDYQLFTFTWDKYGLLLR